MGKLVLALIVTGVLLGSAAAASAETARTTPVMWEIGSVEGAPLDDPDRAESGPEDRETLVLTLYQQGPAQVAERRNVGLRRGEQELRLLGVPASLQADTLMVVGEGSPRVARARLRQGQLTPERLLAAHQGREITLIRDTDAGDTVERTVRVLAVDGDRAVVQGDAGIETLPSGSPWRPVFQSLPPSLPTVPALDLVLTTQLPGQQRLDFSYLADGLDWQVGYVMTVSADTQSMGLDAWATLRNRTGTPFPDTDVRLVAGASADAMARPERLASRALDDQIGDPEAVADQYRFRLQTPVSLEAGDEQQVRFLGAEDVPLTREYRMRGGIGFGRQGRGSFQPVTAHLTFVNDEPALGQPLPGGRVRVYQLDSDGEPVLAGEDRLRPTPKGEEAEITIGAAFDLTAERRQTGFRRLDERTEEQAWEIRLRNAGEVDREVTVMETLPGDWTMLEESADHTRPEAGVAHWTLDVPAGGEATLSFTAEIRR